ncbi:hypothetical protein LPTSP4_06420 [Leptospira ryugenii]|uniref:Uncharacterized protein n=1 Tax=Leptospira ryugenii TaxID=1917863 RepID=A0A2P2DX00_9LEPT|nr:hypothetical protein [Leptospira ryugenii]GBF49132.1 hypothetical protein LPTSP4_06420 [Leptospira ryugenii]
MGKFFKFHLIRYFPLILYFALPWAINADKLKWKNGTTSLGKAISITSTFVLWQEKGKTVKILLSELEGVEVGYEGIPVCVQYVDEKDENCEKLLHKINGKQISFVDKENPLKLEILPIKKFQRIKAIFSSEYDYSYHFQRTTFGLWETQNFKGFGTLISVKDDIWEIQTDGKTQAKQSFKQTDLISFEFLKKPEITEIIVKETPKVIPGYQPVIEKKYGKAVVLFGGTAVSALGMLYEYNQSVDAINKDLEVIPGPNGQLFLVSNVLGNDRYEFHNQRFRMYSLVFLGFLSYSLYDSFYLGQNVSEKGNSNAVWLKPWIRDQSIPKERPWDSSQAFKVMQYGFEFETRF